MVKKIISFLICFLIAVPYLNFSAKAYSAVSYCLYDPICNKVLAASNMNSKMPMASTTKIMTAIIVCEICDIDEQITITKQMVAAEGSSVGLAVNDKISIECLLYGMMLESGNDAALSIAIAISGSKESFSDLMNEKAKAIGMKNSHFVTPNGLDDKEHYSTAYDMALLGGYAMNNELFRKVVATKYFKAIYNNGETTRTYRNHNRLLRSLEGAEGIKTGFTKKSGRCLVSSCKKYGVRLIAVTLKAGDDWNDHKQLFNFGFEQYQKVTLPEVSKYIDVVGSKTKEVKVISKKKEIYFYNGLYSNIKTEYYIPKFVYSPVLKNQKIGYVKYTYNNSTVAIADVISTETTKIIKKKQPTKAEILKQIFITLIGIK